ncbi:UNVERIFIED_CONTAM: hypothetical protein FKN15_032261 [Acipenser sinensis]
MHDSDASMWCFGHELSAILVKQEPNLLAEPTSTPMVTNAPQPINLAPLPKLAPMEEIAPKEQNPLPLVKAEPREVNQFLNVPSDELVQLPPTPPSSHGSDSDGSQSPHSLPPSSPVRPQARTSTAISSSPLLTAPHKLQGTSGPLMLTEEEKRTLVAEGYPVPNKLPLTKTEEKALKRVRRKIKNKISAQESRRKKKEYVECLEKKVETYTSENNELTLLQQLQKLQTLVTGKVPRSCKMASTQTGTCLMDSAPAAAEAADPCNRKSAQILQNGFNTNWNLPHESLKLLFQRGSVSSLAGLILIGKLSLKGTSLLFQVVVLCFVLVLGSFMPSIPEFSSVSQTVESTPLSSSDAYTSSQIRSRSLLFYDEGASLEDRYSSFLAVDHTDDWEASPKDLAEEGEAETRDPPQGHANRAHEASKYLSKLDVLDFNRTDSEFIHQKEQFHERDVNSDSPAEFV